MNVVIAVFNSLVVDHHTLQPSAQRLSELPVYVPETLSEQLS